MRGHTFRFTLHILKHANLTSVIWISCLAFACAKPSIENETAGADPEAAEDSEVNAQPLPSLFTIEDFAETPHEARTVTSAIDTALPFGAHDVVLRKLRRNNVETRLVANADTFETDLVAESTLLGSTKVDASSSVYNAAIFATAADGGALKTMKIAPLVGKVRAVLTVDMCQSSKAWEKRLFDWAVTEGARSKKPFPIAIAMTGGWANAHPNEFAQLQTWKRDKKLAIEWVNHSMNHPVHCNASKSVCTFLTDPEKRSAAGYGPLPSPPKYDPGQLRAPGGSSDGGRWAPPIPDLEPQPPPEPSS